LEILNDNVGKEKKRKKSSEKCLKLNSYLKREQTLNFNIMDIILANEMTCLNQHDQLCILKC
jgi:hypothetical protein